MEAQTLGFAHFFGHADAIAKFILALLALMSVATWNVIVSKLLRNFMLRRRSLAFLRNFWQAHDMRQVTEALRSSGANEPFGRLVAEGLSACDHHRRQSVHKLVDAGTGEAFLTRALRRSLDRDGARLESGLTLLASVGSSAPFVGLFGTVWGVYHALVAIGMQGQGTLDKVAGPVGEALIMTGIGLAVAIPAVLAYNFFTRANRNLLAELDSFAHDVFAFLSTGHRGGGASISYVTRAGNEPAASEATLRTQGAA